MPDAPPPPSNDTSWRPALEAYAIGLGKIMGAKGKVAAFNQANKVLGFQRACLRYDDAEDEGDDEEDVDTGYSILSEADALEGDGDGAADW
jgi:hypothetical protein